MLLAAAPSQGTILTNFILIIIAYCCENNDRGIAEQRMVQRKWVILLYIGGFASLACVGYYQPFITLISLLIYFAIVVLTYYSTRQVSID